MKNTLLKVWGIVLTVAILAGLLMIAAPVSAANLSWSTLGSPVVVTTTVANVYAFANNGKTVFSYDGAALNQSLDGGVTWSASNLGTGINTLAIKSIVVDPTNSLYMVATNGTNVYRTQNGGVNWSIFNPPAPLTAVTSIDTTTDAYGQVVLVGYDAAANAGGVALYENGTWYTTWAAPLLGTAALTAGNWNGTGPTAASAYAVKLSPNYPNDGALTAVAGSAAGFKLRTLISSLLMTGGTPAWGGDVMDATLSLVAAPVAVGAAFASIDMPSDYYWASSATDKVFVGIGDTTSAALYDGIYRVDGVLTGTPRVPVLYSGASVFSIDYQGSSTTGVLAVGQYNKTDIVTATDAITVTSLTAGATWITSLKNPTGTAAAPSSLVRFTVAGTTTNLYAGTTGVQSGLFLATNANSYASFSGIAFISVSALANVSLTPTAGRTSTGSVITFQKLTDSGNAVNLYFKSVDSSATWQEIFSLPSAPSYSIGLSPTFATDNTMYLTVSGQSRIYKSIDGGATFNINATYGNTVITAFSAIDGTNYWFANASGIRSTLSTSALVNLNGKAPTVIINYGTFMSVSTNDGDIWVSTDAGVTFTSLGVPAVTGTGATTVSTTDVGAKTIYILDSTNNIWNYTIGTSTAWTQFLSSTILTAATATTTGAINLYNNAAPPVLTYAITSMSKATGAWYFRSNNNINGQLWRSTNLATGSFEAVSGSAFNAATFGTPVFSPTIVAASGNNTIYMAVGYNTGAAQTPPSYNYKWTTFTDSVLAAPATVAPVASANTTSTVDFSWKAVTNATSYDIQIAYDSAFNNIYKSQIATTAGQYPSTIWAQVSLNPGQTYYWRVRVSLASPMASTWSAGVMFTTQLGSVSSTGIDVGRYPTPGATGVATNSFSWGTVAGATTYEFKISTKADFSDIVDSSVGLTGTVYQTLAKLTPGTTYFWEVRAVAGTVTGPWVTATFTTATAAQVAPATTAAPITIPQATIIIPTQPAPVVNVTVPTPTNGSSSNATPAWAWVVIAIAAVLVIAVIVLIARTRRV